MILKISLCFMTPLLLCSKNKRKMFVLLTVVSVFLSLGKQMTSLAAQVSQGKCYFIIYIMNQFCFLTFYPIYPITSVPVIGTLYKADEQQADEAFLFIIHTTFSTDGHVY